MRVENAVVILALDTSTEACSCALSINGTLTESHVMEPRQHARLILPMIESLLADHSLSLFDVDAIAFGQGPGSFTGLRIAAGVTQGLAFASARPVVPVSTLAAIALDVFQQTGASKILACIDARIDEIYWAQFRIEGGLPVCIGQEHLGKPELIGEQFASAELPCAAGGNGLVYLDRLPEGIRLHLDARLPELLPRAGHIATIAAALFEQQICLSAEEVRPVYLRDKVTHN